MYQAIIRRCFKFFQARLKPAGFAVGKQLTTHTEIRDALDELCDYNDLEASTVVHDLGQPTQYMCFLYVARNYRF